MPVAPPADLTRAHRILVYGVTGSGKSTATRRIAEALGLPAHDIDAEVRWLPNWTARDRAEQRALVESITQEPAWVLDSLSGAWRDIVLDRVELIVALDYPRWLAFGRLVRRTIHRLHTREEVCNGNTESLRQALSPNSILVWHAVTAGRRHHQVLRWGRAPEGPRILRLPHPRDLDRLLAAETVSAGNADDPERSLR